MSYIIDIILVAILVLIVFLASKKGLVVTLFDIASGIIAFIAAKLLSPIAADYIYGGYVREGVIEFLSEKYNGIEASIADAVNNIASVFSFLPSGVLQYADSAGFLDSDTVASGIMESITTVSQLETKIVAPVVTAIITIVCFAVLALILLVVLRIVGRLLAKLVTMTKLTKRLDSILGAVLGAAKGCIYVFILAAIISVVSYSSETLASYAANSVICGFVSGIIGI